VAASFWAAYAVKLAIAGAVLLVLYAVAKRLRGGVYARRPDRYIEVLESRMLAPQAAVHLLRVGTRYVLVGAGGTGLVALAELNAGELNAAELIAHEREAKR
jgi:flagellar biogenesis protein FliO